MKKKGGKHHGGSGNAPTISDPRFSALHSDPRFQKLPRNKLKVTVDKRFERMFTDKEFLDPFSIDKRGRPKKKKEKRTLERYYKIEDEQKEEEEVKEEEKQEDEEEEQETEEFKQEVSRQEADEGEESETDASSSSSESEASLSDVEVQGEEDEEKIATTERETRRIAVVNMDWAHIKAADLLVLFNSFLPKGGRIESVTVYPSQFGLEQMKQEEVKGPHIFKDDDPDDEDGAAINQQKLREYEKSKLRYYFAVVDCDSVSTASFLYNACDGTEFERTSNILDLRFIPDDMKFEVEPRDTATEVPQEYEAPDFCTGALQHSKVKLTWDDDEAVRVKHLRRKFNAEELEKMDFKTYLASDDDEEDEEDEEEGRKQDKIVKYKSLLADGEDENSKKSSKHDIDMEVTFPSGLEELSKKLSEQKQKSENSEETVWEAYLRKKKEKKKGKQQSEEGKEAASQKQVGDEPAAENDEFNDPFFNSDHDGEAASASDADEQLQRKQTRRVLSSEERQKKREERLQRKKDEENSKAELELLLMDDQAATDANGGVKGFNLKKKKKERAKKRNRKEDADAEADELFTKTNYDDPRFQSLFTSPDFAVDPTNPQFKRSAAKLRAVAELQQRRFKREADNPDGVTQDGAGDGNNKQKAELSSLVRSVKRKIAK